MNDLFADVYEFFYYSTAFSQALYTSSIYSILGLVMIASSLFFVLLFYYAINHPRFNLWYHWLLILVLNSMWAFLFGVLYPRSPLESAGMEFQSEYYALAVVNSVLAFVVFLGLSFGLRWWSSNCKKTPIPQ